MKKNNLSPTENSNLNLSSQHRFRLSFLYAIPIGLLGGLIGLGGAEFRLPVLAGVLDYRVHQAIPLNLAVSLITIIASLLIRAIGMVSSLLGVAGGEVIIPTLVFGFGADIKTAGTASLLVSLPTVLVGLSKYVSRGALRDRHALQDTVAPMGFGSIIGAFLGGLLVGIIPASALKLLLGIILNISAFRVFYQHQG